MSLREVICRWEDLASSLLEPSPVSEPTLVRTARELAARHAGIAEPPTPASIEELTARFHEALAAESFAAISTRDWARAAFCLWHGEPPLASLPGFIDRYIDRLEQRPRRGDVRMLISAYLREFAPGRPELERIARVLSDLVTRWSWPWAERAASLRLFVPSKAPAALAEECLADSEPNEALQQLGLDHLHGQGLVLAAQLTTIHRLEADLAAGRETEGQRERVIRFAIGEGGVSPRLRAPLADALLRPWLDRPVPDDIKQEIQNFFLQHYGDPRLRPQRWGNVSDEARQVFRKWLARVALAQFLDVIDRLALAQHWVYRRAFWTAYFEREWIWDAQVALDRRGARLAKSLFGQDAPFATLDDGGRKQILAGHAVLLMRLGNLTIADWSHNGQCAIWLEGNRCAPSLQRAAYTSDDVDWPSADMRQVHAGAPTYAWQRKVRDFIHQRTGLCLSDHEFRVP